MQRFSKWSKHNTNESNPYKMDGCPWAFLVVGGSVDGYLGKIMAAKMVAEIGMTSTKNLPEIKIVS